MSVASLSWVLRVCGNTSCIHELRRNLQTRANNCTNMRLFKRRSFYFTVALASLRTIRLRAVRACAWLSQLVFLPLLFLLFPFPVKLSVPPYAIRVLVYTFFFGSFSALVALALLTVLFIFFVYIVGHVFRLFRRGRA